MKANKKLNLLKNTNESINTLNLLDSKPAPIEKKDEPERQKFCNFKEEIKNKENYTGMDIVFVLDSTGSMGPYLEGAKESLKTVIEDSKESLKDINANESSFRFAIVAYRDHPPRRTLT